MKKISIAILNWNGVELLKQFLGGVVEHSPSDLCEVVVIDNGSTDSSVEYVRSNFEMVRVIELSENFGFTGGYNRGIEQIDSQYVVLLNSDVEVKSDWVAPLLNVISSDESIAVVSPKILSQKSPTHFEYAGAAGGFLDKYGFPFCRGRILNMVEQDSGQYDTLCDVAWASGAAMMIRTALYKEVGGLDEAFFAHQEEIDICWRLRNMGYRIVVEPRSEVFHVGGATLDYKSPRKLLLNHRNSLYMMHKNTLTDDYKFQIFRRMIIDGVLSILYLLTFNIGGFKAVISAHNQYRAHKPLLEQQRQQNISKSVGHTYCQGVYTGSIFVAYLFGKRTFRQVFKIPRTKQ